MGYTMKNKFKKITLSILSFFALIGVSAPIIKHFSEDYVVVAANPASGASFYATNEGNKYYEGIDESLTGLNLMNALATLTSSGFVSQSYSSLASIYTYSDASLSSSGQMQMVYTGTTKSFSSGSMPSGTNKEHVWPASWYGNDQRTEAAGTPGADAHNVWPSASELNSKRGTAAFDELDFATSYKSYEFTRTDWSYGTPGDNDSYVWTNYFNYTAGDGTKGHVLYPSRGHRGAIARILMYVATRYRNDSRFSVMLHDKGETLRIGRIGKLSTLLKWHYEEPPSAWEMKRNNEVATRYHHNRNPFIDNPEYATKIFYHLPEPGMSAPTAAVKNVIETYSNVGNTIAVNKTSVSLLLNEEYQLSVTRNPNNEVVTWSSNDQSIATVTSNGLVKALSVGNTTITASTPTSSVTIKVYVSDGSVPDVKMNSLSFNPTSLSMETGSERTLNPLISPSDTTNKVVNYESNNTAVVTISENGDLTALNVGEARITARSTDGSNLSATVDITVTAKNPAIAGNYYLVKDHTSLQVGDKLVITSALKNVIATNITSGYLGNGAATFSSDQEMINTMAETTETFTLGGTSGAWTLTNARGEKLGVTSLKNLAWDNGTLTWDITISSNSATIQSTTASFGRLLYNVGSPRFNTYTSTLSTSMLLPEIYRAKGSTSDPVIEEVHTFANYFMELTASECAANNVLESTWNTLKDAYLALSSAAKNYFYDHYDVDPLLKALIARYSVILDVYQYENFITNSEGALIYTFDSRNVLSNELTRFIPLVIAFILVIAFSVILFTYTKKKKLNQ